jgi:dephospho-CoA kinase
MMPGGRDFIVVGVTGGVASGKSSLCRMLAGRGAAVIDADAVSREVTAPGSETLSKLVERFGTDILLPTGELDRGALSEAAFAAPEGVRDLNRLTHPAILGAVGRKVEDMAASGYDGIVVVEAALIVEETPKGVFDLIVAVVCSDAKRRERLSRLPQGAAVALERMSRSQFSDRRKAAAADYVLSNEGDLEELESKAGLLWRWLMERKKSAGRGGAGASE